MRSHKPLKLFRVWDVVLVFLLFALVAGAVCLAVLPKSGAYAEVYVDGEFYQKLSLGKDAEVSLEHLTIVVQDGSVFVRDADCKDKICARHSPIKKVGDSIVCLPNRIVIRIVGEGEVEAIS